MYTRELEIAAWEIREEIIKMLTEAGSGHSGGPLGTAVWWACLYLGGELKHKPKEPWWEGRDRVVVSAGHYCPAVYGALSKAGYFPGSELSSLRKMKSRLQGHPQHNQSWVRSGNREQLPGIETSGGPLGQGISQAVGMAIASQMDSSGVRVWAFVSDGELQEGQTWEALMLAGARGLWNLGVVVDSNNIQISGKTEDVLKVEPVRQKLTAWGFEVEEVEGEDIEGIMRAIKWVKSSFEKPRAIVLRTVPGKGVSFMEGKYEWHGKAPRGEEAQKALTEIRNRMQMLN
ncbi:hypothetical protein A2368_02685 [Candidatus Collierbacteria bacterium RIFOXYB1_FULL_49_13]|uniref:Transketolase N-terminal domain-containing protein n=1 Tax=Candidatus Collierbacteria bacterium RIFOXYB1_FULL_49_13 TaxID=1817728 RepID=A0A1F5FJ26_9BACT|nr:MAG: hypothetical protein A2368_02685 [Candidatus Collierbacteria bacterium RIFOXYB1_FULL_49_13]